MYLKMNANFDLRKLSSERAKLPGAKTVRMHVIDDNIQFSPRQWEQEFLIFKPGNGLKCPIYVTETGDIQQTIATYLSTMNWSILERFIHSSTLIEYIFHELFNAINESKYYW